MNTVTEERRVRLLSLLLLLTVFFAGSLTGAVVSKGAWAADAPVGEAKPAGAGLDDLGLDAEQAARLDEILAGYQPAVDSIISSSMEALRGLMREADGEVRLVLRPEQLDAYDRLLSSGPRIRAVRRTVGPTGDVVVDTIR